MVTFNLITIVETILIVKLLLENLASKSLDNYNNTIWDEDEETKMSKVDFDNLIHLPFCFAHLDIEFERILKETFKNFLLQKNLYI